MKRRHFLALALTAAARAVLPLALPTLTPRVELEPEPAAVEYEPLWKTYSATWTVSWDEISDRGSDPVSNYFLNRDLVLHAMEKP